jgi:hypothetical protein
MKKLTAVQQAIDMVRSRMESMDDTLMGKHSAHHLQQVERLLYNLLLDEKHQISMAHLEGATKMHHKEYKSGDDYYEETYGNK